MSEDRGILLGLAIGSGLLGFVYPLAWIATVVCFALFIGKASTMSNEEILAMEEQSKLKLAALQIRNDRQIEKMCKEYGISIEELDKRLAEIGASNTHHIQQLEKTPTVGFFSRVWAAIKLIIFIAVVGFILYLFA